MTNPTSLRRIAENEVVFRRKNESVVKGLEHLEDLAKETNQPEMIRKLKRPLRFYCECSDENCRKRIKLSPNEYAAIHKQRSTFIVLPGHEVTTVENVKSTETNYFIVEKFIELDKTANILKRTKIDN